MAQFLYERHSVNVHLNMVKRHIRLARQIKGAEELGTVIEPLYNELLAKTAAANVAAEETEFKRDILTLKDAALDDVVRDVNDACKKYDRDHPGSSVTDNLFPGGISPIVYAPIESEPTLVGKIILAIANLGEGHLLAQYVPHLQAAASEAKSAIDELHTALPPKKKKKNGRCSRYNRQNEPGPPIRTKHLCGKRQIRQNIRQQVVPGYQPTCQTRKYGRTQIKKQDKFCIYKINGFVYELELHRVLKTP